MRMYHLLAATLLLAGCTSEPFGQCQQCSSQNAERTLVVDGVERRYLVFIPPRAVSATPVNPLPVILAFHWTLGSAAGMSGLTGFNEIAAREGFIVAYPEAVGGIWNDLRPGANPDIDDIAFTRAILDDLRSAYPIDSQRIYATGLSAGGHMCALLAFRMSDQIAAIAPVAALLAEPLAELASVLPPEPTPVLTIAGTHDPIEPYGGGRVLNRGTTLSADDTVAFWVGANGASPIPHEFNLPDLDPNDGTLTYGREYPSPPVGFGAAVKLLTVQGGGHTWPGGPQYLPAGLVGGVSSDFSASEEIWAFFLANARRR